MAISRDSVPHVAFISWLSHGMRIKRIIQSVGVNLCIMLRLSVNLLHCIYLRRKYPAFISEESRGRRTLAEEEINTKAEDSVLKMNFHRANFKESNVEKLNEKAL